MKNRTALIDGDIIARACAHVCEKKMYLLTDSRGGVWGSTTDKDIAKYRAESDGYLIEDMWEVEPVEHCLYSVKHMLKRIVKEVGASDYHVFLTGRENFRKNLYDEYKANRKATRKPEHLPAAQRYLIDVHAAIMSDGEEADDMMGYYQTEDSIICTLDKDLDMIPGWHYNWKKEEQYYMNEDESAKCFYTQLLTGDPVDNIPGIKGIGKVKAAKILADVSDSVDMFQVVLDIYKDQGYTEQELIRNARLLWIRREEEQVWEPPYEFQEA